MIKSEIDRYLKAGRVSMSLLKIGLYLFVVILPLLIAFAWKPGTDHPFVRSSPDRKIRMPLLPV